MKILTLSPILKLARFKIFLWKHERQNFSAYAENYKYWRSTLLSLFKYYSILITFPKIFYLLSSKRHGEFISPLLKINAL